MELLRKILQEISGPDEAARTASAARWDSLAKPLGSLGLLEEAVSHIAAVTGDVNVALDRRVLLVLCADNGVVAQGVTQTDSSVTSVVANALAANKSTVCHMAEIARCQVVPVDMGILNFTGASGVLNRRIRNGAADITQGPAMTCEQCVRAVETGIQLVWEYRQKGASIIATGEMGIGNTTTSSAVASVLLNKSPEQVAGRGAGLSNAGLVRKIAAIDAAIEKNRPDANHPLDVMAKVGGLDIAGMAGIFLGGARYRIPILIDGFISAAAALCAARLCPSAKYAMLASHVSAEPAGRMVLNALGLKPFLTAEMRLGEGSGAVAVLPLLDMALAVYHQGRTFDCLGMEAYTPQ